MSARRALAPSEPAAEVAERTLPHNLEAERSVLGAILTHNDAWERAIEHMRGEDFYRDAHRRIWKAMAALIERRSDVDFVTLKDELNRQGDLDDCGGPAYISQLGDGVPRATNVRHYAGIVRDKALLREIIYASNRVLTAAYEGEQAPLEILRRADVSFLGLQQRRRAGNMASLQETANAMRARLEWRVQHRGELIGVDTGFPSINELTMGWQQKDLIIVAARPSIGKTVFAINSAVAAARTGKRGAVFSYEMRREQLEDRILSSLSGVELTRLQNGALGSEDYRNIAAAFEVLHTMPLHIDDRSGQTVGDIRNTCRRMKAEHGLDFVVIDYVQLIPGSLERRGANRTEEVTDISRRIKELAGELDIPILLLSQLKRLDPRRADPRPQLDDLRESGSLEQDADDVCFLHRRNHKLSGTTEFIREKARNGPTGTLNLTITRETVTFTDGGEPIPDEPAKPRRTSKRATGQPALPAVDDDETSE